MQFLVVEHDERLRDNIRVGCGLRWPACPVVSAPDVDQGRAYAFQQRFDVAILDLDLPGHNTLRLVRDVRDFAQASVILLSSHGEETALVRSLEQGADFYLPKPFSMLVLLAQINAVLRRSPYREPAESATTFVAGPLVVDFTQRQVSLGSKPVTLGPIEYKVLYHLVRNAGRIVPRRALVDQVWGPDAGRDPHMLNMHISRLRAKIEPQPRQPTLIQTVAGQGYRFAGRQESRRDDQPPGVEAHPRTDLDM